MINSCLITSPYGQLHRSMGDDRCFLYGDVTVDGVVYHVTAMLTRTLVGWTALVGDVLIRFVDGDEGANTVAVNKLYGWLVKDAATCPPVTEAAKAAKAAKAAEAAPGRYDRWLTCLHGPAKDQTLRYCAFTCECGHGTALLDLPPHWFTRLDGSPVAAADAVGPGRVQVCVLDHHRNGSVTVELPDGSRHLVSASVLVSPSVASVAKAAPAAPGWYDRWLACYHGRGQDQTSRHCTFAVAQYGTVSLNLPLHWFTYSDGSPVAAADEMGPGRVQVRVLDYDHNGSVTVALPDGSRHVVLPALLIPSAAQAEKAASAEKEPPKAVDVTSVFFPPAAPIKVTGNTAERIHDTGPAMPRVDSSEVAAALGTEPEAAPAAPAAPAAEAKGLVCGSEVFVPCAFYPGRFPSCRTVVIHPAFGPDVQCTVDKRYCHNVTGPIPSSDVYGIHGLVRVKVVTVNGSHVWVELPQPFRLADVPFRLADVHLTLPEPREVWFECDAEPAEKPGYVKVIAGRKQFGYIIPAELLLARDGLPLVIDGFTRGLLLRGWIEHEDAKITTVVFGRGERAEFYRHMHMLRKPDPVREAWVPCTVSQVLACCDSGSVTVTAVIKDLCQRDHVVKVPAASVQAVDGSPFVFDGTSFPYQARVNVRVLGEGETACTVIVDGQQIAVGPELNINTRRN